MGTLRWRTVGCFAAVAAVTLAAAVVWWPRQDETRALNSADAMAEVLRVRLPPGTPLEHAEAYLERRGFRCGRRIGADWVEHRYAPGPSGRIDRSVVAQEVDLLDCSRRDSYWREFSLRFPLPLAQYWHVGVLHVGDRVTAVYVNETKMK